VGVVARPIWHEPDVDIDGLSKFFAENLKK